MSKDIKADQELTGCFTILIGIVTIIGIIITISADINLLRAQLHEWKLLDEFEPEYPSETLIIITSFYEANNVIGTDPHRIIRDQLQEVIRTLPPETTNVRIEISDRVINPNEANNGLRTAKDIGSQYNASLVIWGQSTGTQVTTGILNRIDSYYAPYVESLTEDKRTPYTDKQGYLQYIKEELPEQINFFALLAISGHMYEWEHYEKSAQVVEHAIEIIDQNNIQIEHLSEAQFLLARAYEKSGNTKTLEAYADSGNAYNDAIEKELTKQDPSEYKLAKMYYNRGTAIKRLGFGGHAIDDYTRSIELAPEHGNYYAERGITYFQMGMCQESTKDINKTIDLGHMDSEAYGSPAQLIENSVTRLSWNTASLYCVVRNLNHGH